VSFETSIEREELCSVELVAVDVGIPERLRAVGDSDSVGDNSEAVIRRVGVGAGVTVRLGETVALLLIVFVSVGSCDGDMESETLVALPSSLSEGVFDFVAVNSLDMVRLARSTEKVSESDGVPTVMDSMSVTEPVYVAFSSDTVDVGQSDELDKEVVFEVVSVTVSVTVRSPDTVLETEDLLRENVSEPLKDREGDADAEGASFDRDGDAVSDGSALVERDMDFDSEG
jgi:hypothetical protein